MNHTNEHSESDRHLVNAVLSGDVRAFEKIVKATERLVTQIVFKLVENNEDRRDLAQDVYLKAFANLAGFEFQARLSTWIGQIAYNTCCSYLQKKKLVLTGNLENDLSKRSESYNHGGYVSPEPDAESLFLKKQQAVVLQTEIARLPPLFRTLITLFHNEQLSYEEIGMITNLPTGTIKSYLFRARKMLKTNLLAMYTKDEI